MSSAPTTHATMLRRVADNDGDAWSQFVDLYAPLIYRFARARGLGDDLASEVRDQCFELLVRKLPSFSYDPRRGRFKTWLFRLVDGRAVDALRRSRPQRIQTEQLAVLSSGECSPAEHWGRVWEGEHLRYALQRARFRVPERDYAVFEMLLEEERSVHDVQLAFRINRNQVYKAKSRVLAEVRRILAQMAE